MKWQKKWILKWQNRKVYWDVLFSLRCNVKSSIEMIEIKNMLTDILAIITCLYHFSFNISILCLIKRQMYIK